MLINVQVSNSVQPSQSSQHNDERQRLINENRLLKKNFLRMSRIIQKHSRLLAKKDEIITKLQEKNSNHSISNLFVTTSQNRSLNIGSDSSKQECVKSEELRIKSEEFSVKFQHIYDSMVGQFGQHLFQFMAIIEEMQQFFENNLRTIERKNSLETQNDREVEAKIVELNTEYSALKCSYDLLTKQNEDFKAIVSLKTNDFLSENITNVELSKLEKNF